MEDSFQHCNWKLKVHIEWPGAGYILFLEPVTITLILQAQVWNQEVGSALDTAQTASKERTNPVESLRPRDHEKKALILERENKSFPTM